MFVWRTGLKNSGRSDSVHRSLLSASGVNLRGGTHCTAWWPLALAMFHVVQEGVAYLGQNQHAAFDRNGFLNPPLYESRVRLLSGWLECVNRDVGFGYYATKSSHDHGKRRFIMIQPL